MVILDKVKDYYLSNAKDLDSFLGTTSFIDTNSKYPNSVIIKFGTTEIIGEVSVWQYDAESYVEFEYGDLTKLDREPVVTVKTINEGNVVDALSNIFDELRKLSENNSP